MHFSKKHRECHHPPPVHSTQCSSWLYLAGQHHTAQIQHNTLQHNTIHYNTILHITACSCSTSALLFMTIRILCLLFLCRRRGGNHGWVHRVTAALQSSVLCERSVSVSLSQLSWGLTSLLFLLVSHQHVAVFILVFVARCMVGVVGPKPMLHMMSSTWNQQFVYYVCQCCVVLYCIVLYCVTFRCLNCVIWSHSG